MKKMNRGPETSTLPSVPTSIYMERKEYFKT